MFTLSERNNVITLLAEVKRWRGILEVPYSLFNGKDTAAMSYTD